MSELKRRMRRRSLVLAGLWLGVCALVALGLVVQEQRHSRRTQTAALEAELRLLAGQIEARLLAETHALRGIASGIASLHGELGSTGYYSELRRLTQGWLRAAMAEQPHWLRLVTVWRVDAFGDADEVFAGDEEFGSNARGRFANAWWRRDGDLIRRVLKEAELADWPRQADTAALDCAWRQQRVCFAVDGRQALLAVPLLEADRVQGVLGIAIDDWLPVGGQELHVQPVAAPPAPSTTPPAATGAAAIATWRASDGNAWQLSARLPQATGLALVDTFDWSHGWPLLIVLMSLPPLYFAVSGSSSSSSSG